MDRSAAFSLFIAGLAVSYSSPAITAPINASDVISENGNTTTVDVSDTLHSHLEWDTFNIPVGKTFEFKQQASNSVSVNNITGSSTSTIAGALKANGHVFLINPNGFVFSNGASISTQGFLASTFDSDFDLTDSEPTLSLSGGNSGSIKIGELSTQTGEYIAFYSPKISINSDVKLQHENAVFSTQDHDGTITLPGLDIGFDASYIDVSSVADTGIAFGDDGKITNTQENGTITLNSNSIQKLFNSNITVPDKLSANDIALFSKNAIDVTTNQNFTDTGINNVSINTTCTGTDNCNINIGGTITGGQLALTLDAKNGTGNVTLNDTNQSPDSHLGSSTGLSSTYFNAETVYMSDNITMLNDLTFSGNLAVSESSNIRLNANNIDIGKKISGKNTNLEIISEYFSVSGIGGSSEKVDNITIYSDHLELEDGIFFNNSFFLGSINPNTERTLKLTDSLGFYGNIISLNGLTLSGTEPSHMLNFGKNGSEFESIIFNDIKTNTDFSLSSIRFHASNSVSLSGEISSKGVGFAGGANLILDSNLTLNDLYTLDLSSTDITSTNKLLTVYGINGSTASLKNVNDTGILFTGFSSINLTGDNISSGFQDINLSANDITLDASILNNALTLSSTSGSINIDSNLTANNNNVIFNANTGSLLLNGINNAKNIRLNSSGKGHQLNGSYHANESFNATNLGAISSNSDFAINAQVIDVTGSNITTQGNINITANDISLGRLTGNNITVSGSSPSSASLNLSDNITATGSLDFYVGEISLLDDLLLKGNINLLDKKTLNEDTGIYTYDANGETVATVNGTYNLTLDASNDEAYLYNFGNNEALASFTLKNDGETRRNLHFVGRPNIVGSAGLSVLGKWLWSEAGKIRYETNNYDLNLSGVTINAVGAITFNTGSGNLSIGDVGSNGLVTDLVIEKANAVSLFGELQLTEPAKGYNFSNANAVNLYHDLTIGSADASRIVNFGDATLDGTHSLTLFSDDITLGEIGSNIALQNLTIFSEADIELNNNINLVGSANINANSLALNGDLSTSGLDININTVADLIMSKDASIETGFGNINLLSETGNIGLGELVADKNVHIEASTGYIYNAIDDYLSNDNTSVNVTSSELTLLGKTNIGESVASPIVIDIVDGGTINAESDGRIYIANLANAPTNSESRIFDSGASNNTAVVDAHNQIRMSMMSKYVAPSFTNTLGLIGHIDWQTQEDEQVSRINSVLATPNLYYSREGWRLGY
ncbi:beta strand repeat-containing protein [Bermanella sp. R86510]|uniref:beta strand repeat-containing protein n=1 Tax=unclassified Bermanella TaxID=2627862 RepID=UPI0037CB6400